MSVNFHRTKRLGQPTDPSSRGRAITGGQDRPLDAPPIRTSDHHRTVRVPTDRHRNDAIYRQERLLDLLLAGPARESLDSNGDRGLIPLGEPSLQETKKIPESEASDQA